MFFEHINALSDIRDLLIGDEGCLKLNVWMLYTMQ